MIQKQTTKIMVDLTYFKSVFFKHSNLVKTVVDLTVSDYPQFRRDIIQYSESNDREALTRLVDQWKDTAAFMGQDELWNLLDGLSDNVGLSLSQIHNRVGLILEELEIIIGEFRFCSVA